MGIGDEIQLVPGCGVLFVSYLGGGRDNEVQGIVSWELDELFFL